MTGRAYTEGEPSLDDYLLSAIRDEAQRHHGALPCSVVAYDPARQLVDALPNIRVIVDNTAVVPPKLREIQVLWPSGATWSIHGPLAPNDTVWIIPAGGDIGPWKATGAIQALNGEQRRFDLSDVVALPGSRAITKALAATAIDPAWLVIAGQVKLGSSAAALGVALDTDPVGFSNGLLTWMSQVEIFVNGLVPGTVSPTSAFIPFAGAVEATSTQVKAI